MSAVSSHVAPPGSTPQGLLLARGTTPLLLADPRPTAAARSRARLEFTEATAHHPGRVGPRDVAHRREPPATAEARAMDGAT